MAKPSPSGKPPQWQNRFARVDLASGLKKRDMQAVYKCPKEQASGLYRCGCMVQERGLHTFPRIMSGEYTAVTV